MKKVSKFFMIAFAAVLSMAFVSCSSDDAKSPAKEQKVEVILNADGTRSIIACRTAWQWLQNNGYTWTGVVKQVACDFSIANADKTIYALTTDEKCENQYSTPETEDFFFRVENVRDVIKLSLNHGEQGKEGNPNQVAKWETGSLQGYEFKNANNHILYAWVGAHVIATNNFIDTQHSGGEMY